MKKMTPTEKANVKKVRRIRAQYHRERDALDAKFKADAEALGFMLVADHMRQIRDYTDRVTALPEFKKDPDLCDELRQLGYDHNKRVRAGAI